MLQAVNVPEAFKGQIKDTRFKTELVLVLPDDVKGVAAGLLTEELTEFAVVGLLHSSDLIEFERHTQASLHKVFNHGVNLQ